MTNSIAFAVATLLPTVADDGGEKAFNVIMIILAVIQIMLGLGPIR